MERLATTLFYGLLLGLAWVRAKHSGSDLLRVIVALMALDWGAANLLFEIMTPHSAPTLSPVIEALIIVALAIIGCVRQSWVAISVEWTFVADEAITAHTLASHVHGSPVYYAMLNVPFDIRVVIVIVSAGYFAVRRARPSALVG